MKIPLDQTVGVDLVGRSEEIERLYGWLKGAIVKAVLIQGAMGAGKTALANRLIEMAGAGALRGRFTKRVFQSVYQETWARSLSSLAEKLMGERVVLKATVSETEDEILAYCSEQQCLVVLDNIETEQAEDARRFVRKWIGSRATSVLVLTSRSSLGLEGEGLRQMEIGGLSSRDAQLDLLGNLLRDRFGDERLCEITRPLDGIPLNLLYLRWLEPKTEDELKERVAGLSGDTPDRQQAIEELLGAISGPTTYFMALGLVRHLQFDEGLLAYLWDRMGGGSTQTYILIRQELIASRLLIPVSGDGSNVYRLNEDIHRQLFRALEHRIGGQERIATIHFFVGEYYLRSFERRQQQTVDDLTSFVYHSLQQDDEAARTYRYVFETNLLPSLHQAGMALQLQDLLSLFLQKTRESPDVFSAVAKCRILIEMAHISNDLSQFEECLELTEQTKTTLRDIADALDPALHVALLKRVWYYSAVAYSNTGQSDRCLSSYFKIVSSPEEGERPDPLACLALSYIAHDLKYRNITRSVEYAEDAVSIAREVGNPHLLAKTLCSLAESYIYTRAFHEEAESCLSEAREKCLQEVNGVKDRREFGRVMKNWGLLAFVERRDGDAEEMLREARATSWSAGDRRRVATADLYLALLAHRRGNPEEAESLLASTVRALHKLGDGRYFIPGAMTYALWKEPTYSGRLEDIAVSSRDEGLNSILVEIAQERRLELYAEFWRERFRPVVLC